MSLIEGKKGEEKREKRGEGKEVSRWRHRSED